MQYTSHNWNLHSRALSIANYLRTQGFDGSYAMKTGWAIAKMERDMFDGKVVDFRFVKADLSTRFASGVLAPNIPAEHIPNEFIGFHSSNVRYFDVDKQAWRSFKTTHFACHDQSRDLSADEMSAVA